MNQGVRPVASELLNISVLDDLADLVRIASFQKEIIYVNPAYSRFVAEHPETIAPAGGLRDFRILERTLHTGEIIQREEALEGQYFSVKTSPLKRGGRIYGAVEVFRNTTVEKRLQMDMVQKNEQHWTEMIAASRMQRALLPEKGYREGFTFDYFYRPAEVLSGDIFDVIEINDKYTAVYVADSVGHGFASSMTTVFISQTLRNIPKAILISPAHTLMEVSRRFAKLNLPMDIYFTCFYGVYHRPSGKFYYTNAGHNCPPLVKRDTDICALESKGMPISRILAPFSYENHQVKLVAGDELLLYTDGIIECRNEENEQFSVEGLTELFREADEDVLNVLHETLTRFVHREVLDDMTALWLKVEE
ncbi:MAG: SpoIIE family protein phosphatase [Tissierellia bacterium]|nr:SpoIIE family protein phosphatase [Tissierellia bacterium]